jgi:hypothetical protein
VGGPERNVLGRTVPGQEERPRQGRAQRARHGSGQVQAGARVSPGGSSPRDSSSPLGGSCYPRRTPSPLEGRAGAAPHRRRPPRARRRRLRPAQPARRRPMSQTAVAARGRGRLGRALRPRAREPRNSRPERPRGARRFGARPAPAAVPPLPRRPAADASRRARLPRAPARHASRLRSGYGGGSSWPQRAELFLGRYEWRRGGGGPQAGGASPWRGGRPLLSGARASAQGSAERSGLPRLKS